MVGVQPVVSRGARHARATFSGFARWRPSTGGKRGRRALPLVRPDGCSAHPPATARSAAELGARCVSFSLCGPSLWMGGHPPTEIVRPRLAPPTLPILRSKGDGHRVAVGWLSAGRGGRSQTRSRCGPPPSVQGSSSRDAWPTVLEMFDTCVADWRMSAASPRRGQRARSGPLRRQEERLLSRLRLTAPGRASLGAVEFPIFPVERAGQPRLDEETFLC
jgi:hypothetical protein